MIQINRQSNYLSDHLPSDLVIAENGWCDHAIIKVSPNFDSRINPTDISLLVIHNISLPRGVFGGEYISDLFLNQLNCDSHFDFNDLRDMTVSSHFLIERSGQLVQFVSTLDRAWHAGLSEFQGRSACNHFSIGIELEGTDDLPFEACQYQTLFSLTKALLIRHPISHITGHENIAPGRKTDPGPYFDWAFYEQALV